MEPTAAESEFYPTPPWPVLRLLEHPAVSRFREQWDLARWFDPCVGEGAIVEAVNAHYGAPPEWFGADIRATGWICERPGFAVHDYLAEPRVLACDVAIFNPPFTKALQFARQALTHCAHVFMLQRRNWLTSALRQDREWLTQNKPAEFLLPERISFVDGTTDNQEYEWYVWSPHFYGVQFLAPTSLAERKQTLRTREAQGGLFDSGGA